MKKVQKATTLFIVLVFITCEQTIQKAAAELKCGRNDNKSSSKYKR